MIYSSFGALEKHFSVIYPAFGAQEKHFSVIYFDFMHDKILITLLYFRILSAPETDCHFFHIENNDTDIIFAHTLISKYNLWPVKTDCGYCSTTGSLYILSYCAAYRRLKLNIPQNGKLFFLFMQNSMSS